MDNYKFIKSIKVPNNVHVFLDKNKLIFYGPLGINTLNFRLYSSDKEILNKNECQNLPDGFNLKFESLNDKKVSNTIALTNTKNTKQIKAYGNTLISIVKQKILGVAQGFFVSLEINGIGYRVLLNQTAELEKKQKLTFKLGYSHDIEIVLPKNVRAFCPKPTSLCIYSINYQFLSQICAKIKSLKKPDVYKGKGIRFKNEIIPLRIGKRK